MMVAVVIILACVLGLAVLFFSATTFALREFSRARLVEMLERKKRQALEVEIDTHFHRLLLTTASLRMVCLLGLVICFVYFFQPPGLYSTLATFGASLLCGVIMGIAIPHLWAQYAAETLLCWSLPVLKVFRIIFWPLFAWTVIFEAPIRRIAGATNGQEETPAEKIEKEILDVFTEGGTDGALGERERQMICGVVELHETEVGEVMTPRTDVVSLPDTATLAEVKEIIRSEGHSRIPVYEETIDQVLGVLYAKDLLNVAGENDFDLRTILRKVPFIPESKPILELLREFQSNKVHMAIVLDEYGGTAGLVSFEDILEEVVGEITDEYESPEPEPVKVIDEDTVEVDARVHVDELNERLRIHLPEDDAYETIGGFVFSTLGRIPEPGEEFSHENVHIRVTEAEERRVNRVRVHVVRDRPEE